MKSVQITFPALFLALIVSGCGGGGETNPPPPPVVNDHLVTISTTQGSPQNKLACFKNVSTPECNLRIYQIMVESFINGNDKINYGTGYGTSHHNGDLQGIIDSLDYIKGTGVNAIWLTPIFKSTAKSGQDDGANRLDATGYFASDYFNVDPTFGTNALFKTLVETAHSKGLYVFMDGVFGHYKDNLVASPTGKLPANGNCRNENGGSYAPGTNQQCADYSKPATRAFFQEVINHWITEYKIDGWRLDQAYQVPASEWAILRQTVETASSGVTYTNSGGIDVHPLGHMVSEIWSSESNIASRGYGTTGSPALKSSFDFPVRYRLVQTLATEEWGMSNGKNNLAASNLKGGYDGYSAYPDHAMPNLMLGNHDLVRFGDLIQRAGLAQPSDDAYWNRHKVAFAFMAAHSGPITLYYGDEIGQEVANFAAQVSDKVCASQGLCDDHVARSSGKTTGLSDKESDLKDYVAKLMQLRVDNPALAIGSRTHVYSNSNVYVDRKDAGSNRVLLVINAKTSKAVITLKASAIGASGDLQDLQSSENIMVSSGDYTINVPALSARFLKF